MSSWNELLESIFVKTVDQPAGGIVAQAVKSKGFTSDQEKRIAERTRLLINGVEGHKKLLRRQAKAFVDIMLRKLSQDVIRKLKQANGKDVLLERAERVLVRFSQVIEEQLPEEARAREDAIFKIRWHHGAEPIGCWYWKGDTMHRGEVPIRLTAIHAAKTGGELDRDLATHVGKVLVEGLERREIDIPNFSATDPEKGVLALKWEPPVIRLGIHSVSERDAVDSSTPEDDDLVVYNNSVELSELVDMVLNAEIVSDDVPVADTSKINIKTFMMLIERLAKAMNVNADVILNRIRLLGVQDLRKEVRSNPVKVNEGVRRLEKLTQLLVS